MIDKILDFIKSLFSIYWKIGSDYQRLAYITNDY